MSKDLFTADDQTSIVEAIKMAEKQTSGEIRVHIEPNCRLDPIDRALEMFTQLQMHTTALKNSVLIYVATEDKKFAIIGDEGIHEKVKDAFWNEEKELMFTHFSSGNFTGGLTQAILKVGEKLKLHFPYLESDTDELSNDISFGEKTDA
ncbi:MAG: TPM domain-containing protein [Bacteroidia bacterium]|nr:TPM domain-containing protein [Bacteroidia bacterium]